MGRHCRKDVVGRATTNTNINPQCEGDKWADMVEKMLWVERQRDAEQVSTVKLAERECMLENQLDNHSP